MGVMGGRQGERSKLSRRGREGGREGKKVIDRSAGEVRERLRRGD